MAEKTWLDLTFKCDGTTGTIVNLTPFVNNASIAHSMDLIETKVFGQKRKATVPGMAGVTLSVNGYVNSTTDLIFGKLLGVRTSITKTVEFGNGSKYYNGEAWPNGIQFSGSPADLQTFSANFTISSALNRTSVGLS